MHIAGLVLARGGSKGLPLKNLALLKGKPLLQWALQAMKACQEFDSLWVSTDHDEIAQSATALGAKVHHRSPHTATDEASSLIAVQEFLRLHPEVDAVGLVQCTSPFVRWEHLGSAASRMRNGYDSVFSATRKHELRWKDDSSGKLRALNFNPQIRPRRQDWSGELVENGMFYFATRNLVLEQHALQAGLLSAVEIPTKYSVDIDNAYDLWLAEQQANYFGLEPCKDASAENRTESFL